MDMRPAKYPGSLSSESPLNTPTTGSLRVGDLRNNNPATSTSFGISICWELGWHKRSRLRGKLFSFASLWEGTVKSCDGRHESEPRLLQLASFEKPFLDLCSLGRGRLLPGISRGSIDEMSPQPNPVWWQLVDGKIPPRSWLAIHPPNYFTACQRLSMRN